MSVPPTPAGEEQNSFGSLWRLRLITVCSDRTPEECAAGYGFSIDDAGRYFVGPGPAGQALTGTIEENESSRLKELVGGARLANSNTCQNSNSALVSRDSRISLVYARGELQLFGGTAAQTCFQTDTEGHAYQILAELEYLAARYYPIPFPGKSPLNPPSNPKPKPEPEPDCPSGKCKAGGGKVPGKAPEPYRLDCKYHGYDKAGGARFCTAGASYEADGPYYWLTKFSIVCDDHTLFEGPGQIRDELTYDTLVPNNAAVPAIEIVPSRHLATEGTYMSILDISYGRIRGNCSVRRI